MTNCLEMKRQKEEFTVLVILSDGKLNNIAEIKTLLEECATLPIFIALLAVGSDCSELLELRSVKMEVFTGDKCLAEREDIVNVESYSKGKNIDEVARKLFRNLPHVVSRYMSLRKKTPKDIEGLIKKKLAANTDNPEG